MQTESTTRPQHGLYRCPFCSNDELVDADESGHKHDGWCGDRVWPGELPAFPIGLCAEVDAEMRERVGERTGCSLPDDAILADVVLALIEVRPEEGRAHLDRILTDEDEWWPTCPCCGRRGELIVPLVPLASA